MRTYTVTKREGEDMGPIDWSYDFRQHFNNYCCPDERKDEMCEHAVKLLRQIAVGDTVSTGWGFKEVYKVCMYDGWPFWRPTPYVLIAGTLGPEWEPFYNVRELRKAPALITVCDKCLQASCWQGIFMCQEAQSAGTVQKTREELATLNRENPAYWKTDSELASASESVLGGGGGFSSSTTSDEDPRKGHNAEASDRGTVA